MIDSTLTDFFDSEVASYPSSSSSSSSSVSVSSKASDIANTQPKDQQEEQQLHEAAAVTSQLPSLSLSSSSILLSSLEAKCPHQGGLCRIEGDTSVLYVLEILLDGPNDGSATTAIHQLKFPRQDFDFATRLFAIMDTESKGQISMWTVKEFVTLRCPVFWRRDEDVLNQSTSEMGPTSLLSHPNMSNNSQPSPTFDEVWESVVRCSRNSNSGYLDAATLRATPMSVEGWMVFCRFIALAQYLEAKRRFSGRHLQQTMRHRNAPRGSEVVMVDVPPAAPPLPLSASQLANYERTIQKSLPLPELDLDHSLLAAHDILRRRRHHQTTTSAPAMNRASHNSISRNHVEIQLFGSSTAPRHTLATSSGGSSSSAPTEFCISYFRYEDDPDTGVPFEVAKVRRSMNDMKWLHDTFKSHKVLGGTLCGRILPPFPGTTGSSQKYASDDSGLASTGGVAVAVATAGVGKLKKGIKSLWGTYVSTSSPKKLLASTMSSSSSDTKNKKRASRKSKTTLPENYYNPNSPACHARQLERYLDYLLEHPALSASFPLNTILKASQSGLVAAKESLAEHSRAQKEISEQGPNLLDGKVLSFWPLGNSSGSNSHGQPNLSWVRTAAQAAIALKVHGALETSGLPAASARLQHASLPNYDSARISKWSDEDSPKRNRKVALDLLSDDGDDSVNNSFEEGVLHVQDELEHNDFLEDEGGGYDLLPLPVPAPERAILNTGDLSSERRQPKDGRYRYGSPHLSERLLHEEESENRAAFIGDIAVDENIDKLREVIGSVDSTLSRCLTSSARIGSSRRESNGLHLGIVRSFDSWEGLRGKFVSQRALLKGVVGMEQAVGVFEDSDLSLVDDMSWQTALAHSAVSAAEDVRSTVRAARTASNAKAAAIAAADSAQAACEDETFESIDEARAIQTRASIARSHAIHAAVIEHEAMTVKRRATMALAHDVKCWNNHRKREVLRTCLAHARTQHEATRRAVDAWSCLKDGFIGSSAFPSTHSRRVSATEAVPTSSMDAVPSMDDVTATIYENSSDEAEGNSPKLIVPVEHDLLKFQPDLPDLMDMSYTENQYGGSETILPLVMASPIPEESEEDMGASASVEEGNNGSLHSTMDSSFALSSSHGFRASVHSQGTTATQSSAKKSTGNDEAPENLTSSMQSLVDGLMTWGGQYDSQEDMALPTGMAASIVLEESGILRESGDDY